jgi:uncharacterized membrane protein YccC
MPMTIAVEGRPRRGAEGRFIDVVRRVAPPLAFGLRVWGSVSFATYVAFWLELDNAYWAGTTAALVCQPQLGASLRKGAFRMLGTLIGAVAGVVLTAIYPQDRVGFFVGLALWAAVCTFVATLLRNFAAYGATLAGFTAAIIASDQLGATGGPDGNAFHFAVYRTTEICVGIVCAGAILAGTDFGGARRRLATLFSALAAEICGRLVNALRLSEPAQTQTRDNRRELIRRVIALDTVIDEAIGESSDLRYRSRVLQRSVDGLLAALAGWRTIANHLARLPDPQSGQEGEIVLGRLPQELRSMPAAGEAAVWLAEPARWRGLCGGAVDALRGLPAETASLRLLADRMAEALLSLSHTLDGLALLVNDRSRRIARDQVARLYVPDWLPPWINAVRVFATVGAIELIWVITAWPNGALAIVFTMVGVMLFSLRAEQAYAGAMGWLVGCSLAAVLAGIVKFALLPHVETFVGFSLAIGLVLVPAGALAAQPWQTGTFIGLIGIFIPILSPSNEMSYDAEQFFNTALAIVGGATIALLSFKVLPPLSPARQVRRLMRLTLRDMRRLATSSSPKLRSVWEGHLYRRLAVLPEQTTPEHRAQMVAALSVGSEIISLRRRYSSAGLDAALGALGRGSNTLALEHLAAEDRVLSAATGPGHSSRLRVQGGILAISEALNQYPDYFNAAAAA